MKKPSKIKISNQVKTLQQCNRIQNTTQNQI
jgi:hypothetical protein